MTNRIVRSRAEERQHWKDFEATNEDRIKAQEQQYYDNQDFITVKWPSREEELKALDEDLYMIRQLREQFKKRL